MNMPCRVNEYGMINGQARAGRFGGAQTLPDGGMYCLREAAKALNLISRATTLSRLWQCRFVCSQTGELFGPGGCV
jgi:hypothetical protein